MAKHSILTEYEEISAISGRPAECKHHCLFGRGIRELAEQDGVYIFLTHSEHNMSQNGLIYQIHENPAAEILSKMLGQVAWEKEYYKQKCGVTEDEARKAFLKRYGRSYL